MAAHWTTERAAARQIEILERMRRSGVVRTHRASDQEPARGRPKAGIGKQSAEPPKLPKTPESAVLRAVGELLAIHPKVALAWRQNTGAVSIEGRFVRFGHPGISDYLGLLRDGRLLAVECKSTVGKLTAEQEVFLEAVRSAGGAARMVRDVLDLQRWLDRV